MKLWLIYALLSAICAAFVSIFGKIGLENLDANAATAIRAIIMAIFLSGVVLFQGNFSSVEEIFLNGRALFFIACSGIAGAMSWLFYFLALKVGKISQIAPIDKLSVVFAVIFSMIFFGEKVTFIHGVGIFFIALGGLIIAAF